MSDKKNLVMHANPAGFAARYQVPQDLICVAITGTPGTGKSSAAREMARILGAEVIDAGKFTRANKTVEGFDRKRKCWIVDTKKLKRKVMEKIKIIDGLVIVEGHYAEEVCNPSIIFVLRCRPDVLGKRLKRRRYPKAKIRENVLAEILDYCTISACRTKKARVYELESTRAGKKSLARIMARLIASRRYMKKYSPRIDYSNEFLLSRKR